MHHENVAVNKKYNVSRVQVQKIKLNLSSLTNTALVLPTVTAWKGSKYGVISGPYCPVFSPNTGKYGPEITPYLDTFQALNNLVIYKRIV